MSTIHARPDPSLAARVVRSVPLLYAEGADAALDRPAHVRAASGMARVGGRVAVVQDDANFIALADPETGRAAAVALPAGHGGARQFDDVRGNKRWKLDLESCVAMRDEVGRELLVAFGSGSSPQRERIVLTRDLGAGGDAEVAVVDASALYALLRAEAAFAGSELNVEGAAVAREGVLRLFNRGNGAPHGDLRPVNATCDLDAAALLAFLRDPTRLPPGPRDVTRYTLGDVDGFPLTFTDAAAYGDALLYTAAAEDSPDAVQDGPVAGSAIGVIRGGEARFAVVVNEDGSRFARKIEGILPHAPGRAWIVIDRDDPSVPSELSAVVLEGDW